tara:strand:- start:442 stop:909 length:468 start_codon:yes stop_codon:yes gene_type:complete
MTAHFSKTIFLIIILSLLHNFIIRPLRFSFNENLLYNFVTSIKPEYNVELSPDSAAIIINKPNKYDDKLWIFFPFGIFYTIPIGLLLYQRNWSLVKKLTTYHLFLSLIPVIFLLPYLNIAIGYIPKIFFLQLIMALGLIFTIIAIKNDTYFLKAK